MEIMRRYGCSIWVRVYVHRWYMPMDVHSVGKSFPLPPYQTTLNAGRELSWCQTSVKMWALSISLQRDVLRKTRVQIFLENVGRMYSSNVKCSRSPQENARHITNKHHTHILWFAFLKQGSFNFLWDSNSSGFTSTAFLHLLLFPSKDKAFGYS